MRVTRKPVLVEASRVQLEEAEYPPEGKFQRFYLSELERALGDVRSGHDLSDDLIVPIKDDAGAAPPERVCVCVLVLVLAKTPCDDGGRDRSIYARGANRATRREFYRKVADALDLLRAGGAFDEACVTTYFDLDLSGARYHHLFPHNNAGQRMAYLDATRLDELTGLIRGHAGMFATKRCLTLVLTVGLTIPGGIGGGPAGRTPGMAIPVPGSQPPVWSMQSDNVSYLGDRAGAFKYAHELAHQGNLTHAADNHFHAGADGNPSPKVVPAPHVRPDSDLLAVAPAETATLRPEDGAALRAYLRADKCCDLQAPDGSSVR